MVGASSVLCCHIPLPFCVHIISVHYRFERFDVQSEYRHAPIYRRGDLGVCPRLPCSAFPRLCLYVRVHVYRIESFHTPGQITTQIEYITIQMRCIEIKIIYILVCRFKLLCRICIQPRKHALDHAGSTAPRKRECRLEERFAPKKFCHKKFRVFFSIRVFEENLAGLGFFQSVSYTKSIPTHEK